MTTPSQLQLVVMGVSGCGKSTIGKALGIKLGLPFGDGDDLHSAESVRKMSSGRPLTDEDRFPWLEKVGRWISAQEPGGIIACSALKRKYRDQIRNSAPKALSSCSTSTPQSSFTDFKQENTSFLQTYCKISSLPWNPYNEMNLEFRSMRPFPSTKSSTK